MSRERVLVNILETFGPPAGTLRLEVHDSLVGSHLRAFCAPRSGANIDYHTYRRPAARSCSSWPAEAPRSGADPFEYTHRRPASGVLLCSAFLAGVFQTSWPPAGTLGFDAQGSFTHCNHRPHAVAPRSGAHVEYYMYRRPPSGVLAFSNFFARRQARDAAL
ncbi:hypothetical protein C8R46DRAFT_1217915 [Mycena filopes]|nr:hypothetical protein C8R46DRAFT_1217909 [Mycena filopes]KAJ7168507.1 hypothetical protein C8R46DRAFT_1217912 [Mycena filopes]KAJ7168510.1 hypothetical protein C8R46DRAFT_1217915 [Mycena filopes]